MRARRDATARLPSASCAALRREHIVFLAPPRIGKTHSAISLTVATLFFEFVDLRYRPSSKILTGSVAPAGAAAYLPVSDALRRLAWGMRFARNRPRVGGSCSSRSWRKC